MHLKHAVKSRFRNGNALEVEALRAQIQRLQIEVPDCAAVFPLSELLFSTLK